MANILPQAETQFVDGNGQPYAGGYVYFYVPNTTTPKNTWQDAAQTILNTNPIVLDGDGRAVIFGSGAYRQQLFDVNMNLVWDQLTYSPVSSADLSGTGVPGGAGLVGFDGTTLDQQFKSRVKRVCTNISQLRALLKTAYNYALVEGYFNPGDGGGGNYYYDASDTTSADNGGTVIVASDGARWKLDHGAEVDAACFGVIPGLADVGAALNKALADHVGKYRLLIPQGIINSSVIIDIPAGADVLGTGPVNSNYGPIISQSTQGTQITSTVANGFAVRIAYNAAFVAGGTNVGNFQIKNAVGKGLFCQSMGTGAVIHDIGIHDCLQEGAQFSYFQDSSLINLEVVNCGAATSYGVTFDTNCNACRVDKLLIVECRQPLLVKDSTFFDFYAAHIEQGEYPAGDPNAVINCAYIAGGFKFQNCQHINLYGGVYVANSTGFLATTYGIAESATPFYLVTDAACKNIKMFGPKFSSPLKGSRFMSATNVELIGPTFNGAVSTVDSIEGTNLKIRGGQAELYDDQTQTNMLFGFFAGRSKVSDFEIICSNPSSTAKVSGALLDGVAEVGNYTVTIDKYYSHLGASVSYKGSHGYGGVGYTQSTDTIDVQKQNAGEAIVINNSSSVLRNLANFHGLGNKYTLVNNTLGTITIQTAGNISTAAPIAIPSFSSIDLKHIPGTSIISPVI